jgi:hypothetical protein
MLKMFFSVLLFAGLISIISKPRFLGPKARQRGIIAALIGCAYLIGTDGKPSGPAANVEAVAVDVAHRDQKKTLTTNAKSPTIEAILGKQSLFVDIRHHDSVYCAADHPDWLIGEFNGEFVALNGIARQWAGNHDLSVYSDGEWIPVYDRQTTDPSKFRYDIVQPLIDLGRRLCPQPPKSMNEAVQSLTEGEKRLVQLGPKYGIRAAAPSQSSTANPTDVPIESDAIMQEKYKDDSRLMNLLVRLVKANNFRCDSISSISAYAFSHGFNLSCNNFRYHYEIEDKGGHPVVKVE